MDIALKLVRAGKKCKIYAIGDQLEVFLQEQKRRAHNEVARLIRLLDRTSQDGPLKNNEKCRPLEDGLNEFKTHSLRVLWFWDADFMILCTHGFVKKSQKTPSGEIERAKKIKTMYEQAKRSNKR